MHCMLKGEMAMHTWEIMVLNKDMHIVAHEYHDGWYQEEAETLARNLCDYMHEYTWQVIQIK